MGRGIAGGPAALRNHPHPETKKEAAREG